MMRLKENELKLIGEYSRLLSKPIHTCRYPMRVCDTVCTNWVKDIKYGKDKN
jgi:hypothetical protein